MEDVLDSEHEAVGVYDKRVEADGFVAVVPEPLLEKAVNAGHLFRLAFLALDGLNLFSGQAITSRHVRPFEAIKDYYITGRANPIFCAVGLR